MSLILIEGVDKTGKSSLAAELERELGHAAVLHFSAPEHESPLAEYVEPIDEYRARGFENIVCDRGHLGERVWPAIFGRPSTMSELEFRWIELWMCSRGALAVHARRRTESIERAFREADPPEPLPVERVRDAVAAYSEAYGEVACPTMAYDHGQRSWMVRAVAEEARKVAEFVRPGLEISPLWIGAHRPHSLVVSSETDADGIVANPQGETFRRAVEASHGLWRGLAFCAMGDYDLRDLWNYLGRPAAFAADKASQVRIEGAGIPLPGHTLGEEPIG